VKYLERAVSPRFAPFVECVWTAWDPRSRGVPERIVPDGCPELIVHLGDPFARRIGTRWQRQPPAFLAGTLTRPWMVKSGPRALTVGVRFRPAGFTALFGGNLAAAADREVPMDGLLGAAGRDLVVRLRRARTAASRLDAAAAWLVEHGDPVASRTLSARAVAAIVKARGRTRIDELAERLECTRRQLERSFARDLGISPKMYARIVRLNAVLARLDQSERWAAVDLALESGSFDQAHLLRDFRLMAGRSPRKPRDEDGEMAKYFTRPERLRPLFLGE
jgi:AraC-like DNA-binding protein